MKILFGLVAILSILGGARADHCSGLKGDACTNAGCFLGSYESCCGVETQYCIEQPSGGNCFNSSSIKCWTDGSQPVQTWSSCLPSDFGNKYKPFTPPSSDCPADCKEGCEWVESGVAGCQQTSCCPVYARCLGGSSSSSTSGSSTSGGSTSGGSTSSSSTSGGSSSSGGSCSNTECPNGYYCKIVGNDAVCIPSGGQSSGSSTSGGSSSGGNPCSTVSCPDHFHCENRGNDAICVENNRPTHRPTKPPHHNKFLCDNVHCPNGFKCKVDERDNVAKCVRGHEVPRVCRGIRCPTGYRCDEINGNPICILEDRNHDNCLTCQDVSCEASGLVCIMTRARCRVGAVNCCEQQPTCIRPSTIAGSTIASIASTIASTGTSGPVNPCSIATCPTGTVCTVQRNIAVCIPAPTSTAGTTAAPTTGATTDPTTTGATTDPTTTGATTDPTTTGATTDPTTTGATTDPTTTGATTDPTTTGTTTDPTTTGTTTDPTTTGTTADPTTTGTTTP